MPSSHSGHEPHVAPSPGQGPGRVDQPSAPHTPTPAPAHAPTRAPRFARLTLAVAALANVGFFLPKVPSSAESIAPAGSDKVVHVLVFALTAWAIQRATSRAAFPRSAWLTAGTLVGWAVIIELAQSLYPLRSADPLDVLADCAGIALGLLAASTERRLSRKRR